MDNNEQIRKKISEFFQKAFQYYGKEIVLDSKQHFNINFVKNNENEEIDNFQIQYGFPQSGCVSMGCSYSKKEEKFFIDEITVYAPSRNEEFIVANLAPQYDDGILNMSFNMGLDMNTQQHNSVKSISENPNAVKMLETAINDLSKAEVIGECMVGVPADSDFIPCAISRQKNKDRSL